MTSLDIALSSTPFRAAAGAANDANPADIRAPGITAMTPIGVVEPPRSQLEPSPGPAKSPRGDRIVDLSVGHLQVRLAEGQRDIEAAQALRYRVFYETMGARPHSGMAR